MQTTIEPNHVFVTGSNKKLAVPEVIRALRQKAKDNKVFNDVAYVFAMRERARQQVTIPALRLRMGENGFNYDVKEYQNVLKFLAYLGFGTLEYDKSKQVFALKNVRVTLQSIGKAAVDGINTLEIFEPQFNYQKLPVKAKGMPQEMVTTVTPEVATNKVQNIPPKAFPEFAGVKAELTVYVEGKPLSFPLPDTLTTKDLSDLLVEINSKQRKEKQ